MAKKPRVYADSCCFIDVVKQDVRQPPKEPGRDEDVARFKLVLEASRDGEISLFTSSVSLVECLHADNKLDEEVKRKFKSLLTSGQYVTLAGVDPFIAEDARDIKWVHGISMKGLDYLHLATAVQLDCSELLTTDRKHMLDKREAIYKKVSVRVRRPVDTTSLSSDRLQLKISGGDS